MKVPNFTRLLYGEGEHNRKSQKISPTFDKLNEIEEDRLSLKQCEFTF